MNTEQILREQIKELKALVELKEQRIQALETIRISQPTLTPFISIPTLPYSPVSPLIVTCQHEAPTMWGGTGPVPCTKCGQPLAAGTTWVITNAGTQGTYGLLTTTAICADTRGAGSNAGIWVDMTHRDNN